MLPDPFTIYRKYTYFSLLAYFLNLPIAFPTAALPILHYIFSKQKIAVDLIFSFLCFPVFLAEKMQCTVIVFLGTEIDR